MLWQRVLAGFTSAAPAVVDGRLFVTTTVVGTSADVTTVRALKPSDGTTQWSRVIGPSEEMSLAVEGDVVALLPSFGRGADVHPLPAPRHRRHRAQHG